MIFNSIVSSSRNQLGQNSPFISIKFMKQKEYPFLLVTPVGFGNRGVQMVKPSLPTLLSLPAWNSLSNLRPFGCPMDLNQLN